MKPDPSDDSRPAAEWHAIARQAAAAGDLLLATQHYERAAALDPHNVSLHLDMGNALAELGEHLRAIDCYGKALRLDPESGHTWNNLGNLFLQLNDVQSAITCYQNAVRLLPAEPIPHYSLGRALNLTGQHQTAIEHLTLACKLSPRHADAWANLGNAHQHVGHFDQALRCFDQALALSDQPAEAHVNRAMILLNSGNFREGWREYEYRWETPAFSAYKKRPFGKPRWRGEPLAGQRILLHAEQGFGDTIQFARFIPQVAAEAAEVYLEVPAPIQTLLAPLLLPGHIIVRGEPLPDFDFHCSLISLPFALDLDFESIPSQPYLSVPPSAREKARRALHAATGELSAHERPALHVGLSWRGNASHRWDQVRSLRPAQLAPLAAIPGVQFVLLQKDARPEELASLPPELPLAQLSPENLHGFLNTAAVIQELDLIISIDTVTAHLTGALGKPLWLLLPAFYDWRWHSHLNHSPWYPSARLFRQHEPGIWTQAIHQLAAELTESAAERAKSAGS